MKMRTLLIAGLVVAVTAGVGIAECSKPTLPVTDNTTEFPLSNVDDSVSIATANGNPSVNGQIAPSTVEKPIGSVDLMFGTFVGHYADEPAAKKAVQDASKKAGDKGGFYATFADTGRAMIRNGDYTAVL